LNLQRLRRDTEQGEPSCSKSSTRLKRHTRS
jgi:hypothetical protein